MVLAAAVAAAGWASGEGGASWAAPITVGSGTVLNVGADSGAAITGFTGFSVNGSATISGGATQATLASGPSSTAGSVWTSALQTITDANGFTAAFTYTAGGSKADEGITFTIQADPAGASALGSSLGYSGITKSVSYQLNLLSSPGSIVNVNGVTGATGGTAYNDISPVDPTSGDPIDVLLSYSNGNLVELLHDTVNGNLYAYGYSVDINTILGGTSGRIGFTAATSGGTSHTITNFSFTQGPSTTPTVSGDSLTVQAGGRVIGTGGTLSAPTWTINGGAIALTNTTASFNSFTQTDGDVAMGPINLTSGKNYSVQGGINEVASMSIASGGSFGLSGGIFSTSSFSNSGGSFSWTGGTFRYTGASALGLSSSTLGVSLNMTSALRLEATGLNLPSGTSLTMNGGTVSTGTLTSAGTITLNSGFLELKDQDLQIQSGGILGATVTIPSPMTLNIFQNTTVASAGNLSVVGGLFCAGFSNSGHTQVTSTGVISANAASTNSGTLIVNDGSLDFGAGANGLTNTGPLSLTDAQINGDVQSSAAASVTTAGNTQLFGNASFASPIAASGTLTFDFGTHALANITGTADVHLIGNGTTGSIAGHGLFVSFSNTINPSAGTSQLTGLTLDGTTNAWTSSLDISNNKVVVEATSGTKSTMLQTLQNQVNFGKTHSFGIRSTDLPAKTMIAVVDNGALAHPFTTFGGVSVDSNSILVAPELGGDANLDGKVDLTDLTILATNWQKSGTWTTGDFDGSGFVDLTDLTILANNWQGTFSGFQSAMESFAAFQGVTVADPASVPEPAGLSILALGALTALARRRKEP